MIEDHKEGAGFVLGFLVGTLVGASIAVILAPRSGAETRETLRVRATEMSGKARDLVSDVKDDANEWMSRGRQAIGRAFHRSTGEPSPEGVPDAAAEP